MTELLLKILERNGVAVAALAAGLYMIWRAAPWFAARIDRSLDRADNALERLTAAHASLLSALAQHELNDEKRHGSMREHVSDSERETRHDLKNALVRTEANLIEHMLDRDTNSGGDG